MPSWLRGAFVCVVLLTLASAVAADWFDSYERGLRALARKDAAAAVEQLEAAIRARPEPGTNVLTYGTNRIASYHPYLRLAEAHLLAGKPDQALDVLRVSESFGREPAAEQAELRARAERVRTAASTRPSPRRDAAPSSPTPAATATPRARPQPVPEDTPIAQATDAAPVARPSATPPRDAAARTPPPREGTLEVRSVPADATVLIDDLLAGRTPLRVTLTPGHHVVILRHDGFEDERLDVSIEGGQTASRSLALRPAARPSPEPSPVLEVFTTPGGAEVYLDDEAIGHTDRDTGRLVKAGVTPGRHRVRAGIGRLAYATDVDVEPDGPTTVRIELARRWPMATIVVASALLVLGLAVLAAWLRRRQRAHGASVPEPLPVAATEGLDPRAPTIVATRTVATPPRGVGERFGEYVLTVLLGRGGMALVYRAERRGDAFALKRPLGALLEDADFVTRFKREAEIGRTLHHPNIVRIHERGEVEAIPFFTMELLSGETLQATIARGPITPRHAVAIVAQVAEALDYAHLKGVIHRDLKPSNIMLDASGVVRVMDYGIARARRFEGLTQTGAFLGTPEYAAPETVESGTADARSDLYSLGCILHESLTGHKLFPGDTPFAILRRHCEEQPLPPSFATHDVPERLDDIVLRLLSKKPDDRHQDAESLLVDLRDFLSNP